MPGYPGSSAALFFAKKGYWVFVPRYRGSWESGGAFLRSEPTKDVIDVIDSLPQVFNDLWNRRRYKVKPDELYVFGSSFGGPAAIFASLDKRVTKAIAISPVIDWRDMRNTDEPLDWMFSLVRNTFGNAYRVTKLNWNKLKTGKFYNPMTASGQINSSKLLLIHAKNDTTCRYTMTKRFANKNKIKLITLNKGGHLGTSFLVKPLVYRKIKAFL